MESSAVNWSKILIYGSVLFFAQVLTGFLEGFLSPEINATSRVEIGFWFALSNLMSFVISAFIFGHICTYQVSRPLLHASLSLVLYGAASVGLSVLAKPLIGSVPALLEYLGWLTLVAGFLTGVVVGGALRHKRTSKQQSVV